MAVHIVLSIMMYTVVTELRTTVMVVTTMMMMTIITTTTMIMTTTGRTGRIAPSGRTVPTGRIAPLTDQALDLQWVEEAWVVPPECPEVAGWVVVVVAAEEVVVVVAEEVAGGVAARFRLSQMMKTMKEEKTYGQT